MRTGRARRARGAGPRRREGRGRRPRGVWPRDQHRAARHVSLACGRSQRRGVGRNARIQRQPPVRLGPPGRGERSANRAAGRCRYRHCRWRGKHEPRAIPGACRPLGFAHGRRQDGRHDARRAARPVPHDPHGCDGGKRRPRIRHQPRAARSDRAGVPPACIACHPGRLLQGPDRSGDDQVAQGRYPVRYR